MNRTHYMKPPRRWSPKLSPLWIRCWRPLRRYYQRHTHRLMEVEVRGLEQLRAIVDDGAGVLITPNHSTHADSVVLYAASDELGIPFYVMAAWQVFHYGGWFKRMIMRQHGTFSVDREGTDLTALRQAREILEKKSNPLVIFPEGEVYHTNQQVTPFREGPAAIALMAARKSDRPVFCVPCAMRYEYTKDPTPELLVLMDELEQAMFWRPRPQLPLPARIYHLAEAMLALKEIEFLGKTSSGRTPERIAQLMECVLVPLEERYGIERRDMTVPERVKVLRQRAVQELGKLEEHHPDRESWYNDLNDLFLVIQAFSYPGDYVAKEPSIERIAETLDKFEEDVLGRESATVRGERRATVTFGAPIEALGDRASGMTGESLSNQLEASLQSMLVQ